MENNLKLTLWESPINTPFVHEKEQILIFIQRKIVSAGFMLSLRYLFVFNWIKLLVLKEKKKKEKNCA